jgi:hypothetical protein
MNIRIALSKCDGQPTSAFLLIDGMTEYKGRTPIIKYGETERKSKEYDNGTAIGDRIIGVLAVCGPIEEYFLYHLDDFVPGGANTMVEVLRLALLDLAELLSTLHMSLPLTLFLQFDNCGENKNKEMFCYLSLLIEYGHFKYIQVNFLIVGHTHCRLDQYFSTICAILRSAQFIATTIALMELLSIKPEGSDYKVPKIQRIVHVIYDVKEAFKDYYNKGIHYYQVTII